VPDVGAQVLPLGSAQRVGVGVVGRHDAVDQIVIAEVELVVAHGRDLQPGLVQGVDGGLVLLDEGLEGGGADQVTGRREHGVRVVAAQLLDRAGQDPGAALGAAQIGDDATVEVVGAQDLHRLDLGSGGLSGGEADDDRVVVGGGVRGGVLPEDLAVVVPPRPVQGDGETGVDVPGVGAGDPGQGGLV